MATEILPLVVQLIPVVEMTDNQFFEFCSINRDLRIERTAEGKLIIMPPTGSETGNRNFNLTVQLGMWTEQNGTGIGFDSNSGFTVPNGAMRSPDTSWIKWERWEAIPAEQWEKFAPICPDFVVELKSATDSLKMLQYKDARISRKWSLFRVVNWPSKQASLYLSSSSRGGIFR